MEATSPLGGLVDEQRVKYLAAGAMIGLVVFGGLAFLMTRLVASGWDMATALAVGANAGLWGGISFGLIGGNAAYELKYGEAEGEAETESMVVHPEPAAA